MIQLKLKSGNSSGQRWEGCNTQQQHIVWQQVFIKLKDTFRASSCQRDSLTNFRCAAFKKVINGEGEFSRLPAFRSRPHQRSSLDGVQLRPAFVDIRFAELGD